MAKYMLLLWLFLPYFNALFAMDDAVLKEMAKKGVRSRLQAIASRLEESNTPPYENGSELDENLLKAIDEGKIKDAALLLELGAASNYYMFDGLSDYHSPLGRAAIKQHIPLMELLLEYGAQLNNVSLDCISRVTVVEEAEIAESKEGVRLLLQYGARPTLTSELELAVHENNYFLFSLRMKSKESWKRLLKIYNRLFMEYQPTSDLLRNEVTEFYEAVVFAAAQGYNDFFDYVFTMPCFKEGAAVSLMPCLLKDVLDRAALNGFLDIVKKVCNFVKHCLHYSDWVTAQSRALRLAAAQGRFNVVDYFCEQELANRYGIDLAYAHQRVAKILRSSSLTSRQRIAYIKIKMRLEVTLAQPRPCLSFVSPAQLVYDALSWI